MPELARIDPATATGDVADLFARVKKTVGVIPTMATYMANSPATLKAWLELFTALRQGQLTPAVRERLALCSAEYNGCSYCLSAHTFLAKTVAKIDDAEIDRARDAASADPHIDAILKLADAIARDRGNASKEAVAQAREAGVTDGEIAEVIGNVALNTLTNYFNVFAGTPSEYPELVQPRGDR